MRRHSCWAVALVLGAAAAAPAQERLAWKFKEGDKFYVESVAKMKQTVVAMGVKQNQNLDITYVYRVTVKKKTADRTVLDQEVVSARATGGGELAQMEKLFEKMKGAVFTLTLDKDNQPTKVEGYRRLLDKIAKDDKSQAAVFKMMFTEDTLRQEVGETYSFLPTRPVAKGARWERTQRVPLGPLGALKAVNRYTYLGETKDGARIGVTADMTFAPPQKAQEGLPFKVTKGDLKSASYKGTILFDARRGRLVRQEVTSKMKMALTIEAMGMSIDMEMEQQTTGTSRVTDRAPQDD